MTQQPAEAQKTLDLIWNQHRSLLLETDETKDDNIRQVRLFLKMLGQAGKNVDDVEDRSALRELIRYWSSYIGGKTGKFPVIQLQPFDRSLKQTESVREPEPSNKATSDNSDASLAKRLPTTPLPDQHSIIWNVPFPRNPFFIGRDDLLNRLYTQLQAGLAIALSQPQAISGLGGIGKTQLAIEYAYRYHQKYEAVLWASAETQEALISSYYTIAMLLNLPEREASKQEMIIQAVKTWLQTHRNWLLIFDNADDLSLLPPLLPPVVGGHILITTRAWDMQRLAHRIEVEALSDEQGAALLLQRAGLPVIDAELAHPKTAEQTLALQLAHEMGGLPLALDQAGAYLEATGTSIEEFQQVYRQHRQALLQERRALIPDHPEPVATTWALSFARVEEKKPAAADLLRLCAYLSPDVIPEEILTEGASVLGPVLGPVVGDPFRLSEAIEALRAYSLLSRDPKSRTLSVHRLVQVVLQDGMDEENRKLWTERAVRAVNEAFPHIEHQNWPQCDRLLPHALCCAEMIEEYQMSFAEAARLLNQTGYYLHERARYQEAQPLYLRALQIREQLLGDEHPDTAASLNNLARLYRSQGRYEEAEPLFLRALQIREKLLGDEHPATATSLENLAKLYRSQERYAEAESLSLRALQIREKLLGTEHPDTARSLNNLAYLYYSQGRYEEAESLYLRALQIREKLLGDEHPDIARSLNNLAFLYYSQGRYGEAEPLYLRSFAIYEKQLGAEHPDTARSLNNLALLYQEQSKYEQAEPLYRRAISIYEQKLGPQHPYTQSTRRNYVSFLRAVGRDEEANTVEASLPPSS